MANGTRITVNGTVHEVQAEADTPLLYVLRNELELNGPRFGCGLAQCGACTVLLGGRPIRSCVTPVSAATAAPITTLEGLGTAEQPYPLQRAFLDEQAGQCGYCIPGIIMSAAALLAEQPRPTDAQIREALVGNLCRCGSHTRILRAVRRAAEQG
jgi:nicotinate dehydrogenase subunit A